MSTAPPNKSIVCLVIDRLHAGFVGAYGNTWIRTPNFDGLAAEAFLFDRATIDSPRLENLYRSYWSGLHAAAYGSDLAAVEPGPFLLPRRLAAAGFHTSLLTDEPAVAEFASAAGFGRSEVVPAPAQAALADSVEETHLAELFAVAADWLTQLAEPVCLWLHVGSLGRLWDAPLELREQYRADDDPDASESAAVPNRRLPRDFDPDELLAIVHAYAGQVSLLDLCLGPLLDGLAESPAASRTLFNLLSARGFPLGEHGRVGAYDEALYGELTQIPWLLRLPDGRGASDRTQALVQPPDLCATLLDWCGLPEIEPIRFAAGRSLLSLASGQVDSVRDRAIVVAPANERAIITPAWSLRSILPSPRRGRGAGGEGASVSEEPDDPHIELFAKPDDRFEINEVTDRCRDIAAELRAALTQFEQACQSADSTEPPPLPENLVIGME